MNARVMRVLRVYGIVIAVIMVLPVVVVLLASLNEGQAVLVPPAQWGLHWFYEAVHDGTLMSSFEFSLTLAVIVAVVGTALGTAVGFAVARYRFPGRQAIYGAVLAPLLIPQVALAIGMLEFFPKIGIQSSPYGLAAGWIVVVLPFVVRIIVIAVSNLDQRLEHASYSLGVSRAWTLLRVVAPQMVSGLLSATLLAFLTSFDESVISVFISTPDYTALPSTMVQYYEARSDPLIAAVSAILVLLSLVVVIVLDRLVGILELLSRSNLGTR